MCRHESYFYSSLAEEKTRKKQVVGMKPSPECPYRPSIFPVKCVWGPEGSWLALNQGRVTVKLLSRLKMKQACMRWTICRQKCDENCLTGQTVCFQLRIQPYLKSGVMRIIPQAANYRNLLLRHPAAPGMKIWPTTAHRTVPTHLHVSQRKRKAKS